MSVVVPPDENLDDENQDIKIKRAQFEEFIIAKLTNMEVRLHQLIETSKFDEIMKSHFHHNLKDGLEVLCARSEMGELNVLLITFALLTPYYNAEDDTFDIITFVEKNISETKTLLELILKNNENAMEQPAVQNMAQNVEYVDQIVDTPFFSEVLAITTPYLKMLCELSSSK